MEAEKEAQNNVESLDPIAERIINLAQSKPTGISDKDISAEMPNLLPKKKADVINKLLSQGYFDLFKQGETLLYKLRDPSKGRTIKGADNEEKVVYNIIEEAGNKGIWVREIRFKSNLAQTQVQKILKNLIAKKYIKTVKSVTACKKKLYMLYNLEPHSSVSGGPWYQDQEFESEYVEVLNQQCYRFLEQKRDSATNYHVASGPLTLKRATSATSNEVLKFISDLGISKVPLQLNAVKEILDTLVYDGKVEKTITADDNNLYRVLNPLLESSGLVNSVCGLCPVRKNCWDIGDITPIKCQYMTEWLDT